MQDLSKDYGHLLNLAPSSMNAGNTTSDDPGLAMTAPGSKSVIPVPENPDVLPMPQFTNAEQIPVSNAPKKPTGVTKSIGLPSDFTEKMRPPGPWKETP